MKDNTESKMAFEKDSEERLSTSRSFETHQDIARVQDTAMYHLFRLREDRLFSCGHTSLGQQRRPYSVHNGTSYNCTVTSQFAILQEYHHRREEKVQHRDTISTKIFTTTLENAMRKPQWNDMEVKIDGRQLHHLRFTVDIVLITPSISQAK